MARTKQNVATIVCGCRSCSRSTHHRVLKEHLEQGLVPEDPALDWTHEYQIVQCLGCETVGFRMATGTNLNVQELEPGQWDYVPDVQLFPNPHVGRAAITASYLLPAKIQRIYAESLAALNADQPVLCGIGIRALLETVCNEQNAQGGGLYAKLKDLVERKILNVVQEQILHNVRTLGNKSAHEVEPHDVEELTLAMEVVDHLLMGVYVLPKQAKRIYGRDAEDEDETTDGAEPISASIVQPAAN